MQLCQQEGFYESIRAKAARLADGFVTAARNVGFTLQSSVCGGLFGIAFSDQPVHNFDDAQACDHKRYARFFRAMLDRGVWLPPSGYEALFVSSAHDDAALAQAIEAAEAAFGSIAS